MRVRALDDVRVPGSGAYSAFRVTEETALRSRWKLHVRTERCFLVQNLSYWVGATSEPGALSQQFCIVDMFRDYDVYCREVAELLRSGKGSRLS